MKISILALGKSGSNIADYWKEYAEKIYYINTHEGEMKSLPGDFFIQDSDSSASSKSQKNPIKLCVDGRGTGRSPKTGRVLAEKNYNIITEFLSYHFDRYKGLVIVVVGGGGGSGTGFAPIVCEILNEMRTVNFGIIYTLPMEHEGIPTMPNALNGLNDLTSSLKGVKVAPFMLIDNELLMGAEGKGEENYWGAINNQITNIMLFADLAEREVSDIGLFNTVDPREVVRTLRKTKSNGSVGFTDIKSFDLNIDDPIASFNEGMKEHSQSFVEGYDYLSSAAIMVVIEQPETRDDKKQLSELFDYISKKKFKGKDLLKATVASDSYRVNVLFTGLNAPTRLTKLSKLTDKLLAQGKEKRPDKAKPTNVKGFNDDFEDIDL